MPSIIVRNLRKIFRRPLKSEGFKGILEFYFHQKYEEVEALKGISFEAEPGKILTILGPNGAGKTTILKILTGIIHPTSGTVRVLDHIPQKRESKFLHRIGFLSSQKRFAEYIAWDLPPVDLFRLVKAIYNIDDKTYKSRMDYLISALDITDFLNVTVRKLSMGQKAKVEIIAAVLHFPEVLFLDEPTLGLDVVAAENLRNFIRDYKNEVGATVILTSHYVKDIEDLSDELIVINQGEIIFRGNISQIYQEFSRHRIVKFTFESKKEMELPLPDKILRKDAMGVSYKIEANRTKELVQYFVENFEVKDIVIEDEELEDVIKRIYRGEHEKVH